jgi:hypothetical protein
MTHYPMKWFAAWGSASGRLYLKSGRSGHPPADASTLKKCRVNSVYAIGKYITHPLCAI